MVSRYSLPSLLLLLLFACNNQSRQQENAEVESTGTIQRNGIEISYSICGDKDTSLLFLHGLCINKEYWEGQITHFCKRFKVVAIDMPGFGKSGKNRTDWNFDEYAADVNAVIDQLKLKNVILIGHSMSGDVVLNTANKYPSGIVAIVGIDNLHAPGGPMSAEQKKQTDSFILKMSTNFDSTMSGGRSILFQPTTDNAIVQRVMNDVYHCDSSIAIKLFVALTDIGQKEKELMKGLPVKLYLVNSDVMPTHLDSLNKYCRYGCELVPVHGTSHYPMIEKAAEFNAALEKVFGMISNDKRDHK